jgi:hypothetical protein
VTVAAGFVAVAGPRITRDGWAGIRGGMFGTAERRVWEGGPGAASALLDEPAPMAQQREGGVSVAEL